MKHRCIALCFTLVVTISGLRADDLTPRPAILECRPCGPDSIRGPLRYLFFQGCAGADFRPACVQHDAAYDTYGSDKATCDRAFLEAMLAECENSKFQNIARFRAHLAYLGVKLAGRSAWLSAQRLALQLQSSVQDDK